MFDRSAYRCQRSWWRTAASIIGAKIPVSTTLRTLARFLLSLSINPITFSPSLRDCPDRKAQGFKSQNIVVLRISNRTTWATPISSTDPLSGTRSVSFTSNLPHPILRRQIYSGFDSIIENWMIRPSTMVYHIRGGTQASLNALFWTTMYLISRSIWLLHWKFSRSESSSFRLIQYASIRTTSTSAMLRS
jgi:hypothetical protein